jgi:acyl-CoA thioester hydrolase
MARSDFRFSLPFRIRYAEIDAQSVVFNAHYLTYFDTAITEYVEAIGYDYQGEVQRTGHDYHTVRNVVEYKQPVYFREDIEVFVGPGRIGRTSLTFALEVHPAGKDDLRTTGEVVWVYTNQETHQSAPLPRTLLDLIEAYEGKKT